MITGLTTTVFNIQKIFLLLQETKLCKVYWKTGLFALSSTTFSSANAIFAAER